MDIDEMKTTLEGFNLNRRALKYTLAILVVSVTAQCSSAMGAPTQVEQWGVFEISLKGPMEGNPFVDIDLTARFSFGGRVVEVNGFYDGEGTYVIRFMPDTVGEWSYVTSSGKKSLDGIRGNFRCKEPSPDNHGPVRVNNQYHFSYADGTPYFPFGTTCYAWIHQGDEREEQTLETLKTASFNKMRMCVFPKSYSYNNNEPQYYPFEGTAPKDWDFTRYNPEFFRHLERRVGDLLELGIEADIILFHPYDRWGFSEMDAENDYRYLK